MTSSPAAVGRTPFQLSAKLSFMMFLQYAIWGAWLPILYPFLLGHRGFTLKETGLCLSAGAVGAIFGPFLAGQLADRSFATEKILAFSHLAGAALIYFLAEAVSFEVFAALSLVYGFVYAPTIALTNSLTFAHISDRDRDFGPIRLWGTIGWIVASILVGQYLFRYATPEVGSDAEIAAAQNAGRIFAFHLSAILGAIMGVFCFFLPHTPPAKGEGQKMAFAEAFAEIRVQPLLTLFLIAVPISMVHQFYFVFASEFITNIQNAAASDGADKLATTINSVFGVGGGGLMTIGQFCEIPVLALIPFVSKRVGRKWLLAVGIIAYALRMAIFAYAPSLVPVMVGITLHGVCFGCFIFVAFMVVDEQTTADVRASAQNLFNLVIVGIGIIAGSYFATGVVGDWAALPEGGMNYVRLFSVPMWIALGCLAALLFFYPSRVTRVEPSAN